jgi:hypothetical protein
MRHNVTMVDTSTSRPQRRLTWAVFVGEVLPGRLSEAGVGNDEVAEIVADVEQRSRDYAAGGRASRRALRAPFVDDVAAFEPAEAPLGVRAETAVVVRSSLLENAHARGTVDDPALTEITYLATGPLNAWLAEHNNTAERDLPVGVFAGFADHPRAYAALTTVALAAENGGRRAFHMANAPRPSVPLASSHEGKDVRIRRSGLADIDAGLLALLSAVANGTTDFY